MASIGAQLDAARVSAHAASALEGSNRRLIEQVFDDWESGALTNRQVRHALERVVRNSWRASGAVARAHTERAADLEGWSPAEQTFNNDFLTDLLGDIRRNLREYNAALNRRSSTEKQIEKARARAILRMRHSAGVATTRGYTDALIEAHAELEDFGFRVVKVWMANFVNNTPCPYCRRLHGTRVGLRENFKAQVAGYRRLRVYRDLQGPPRHPQCKCYLAILIITLENAFEPIEVDQPEPPEDSSSAESVRNLPWAIFMAIVAALRAVAKAVRGG